MVVSDHLEVRVLHGVLWGDALGVVVPKHLAEKVKSFVADEGLILSSDELGPWLAGV